MIMLGGVPSGDSRSSAAKELIHAADLAAEAAEIATEAGDRWV
jgi:hypothetical protein